MGHYHITGASRDKESLVNNSQFLDDVRSYNEVLQNKETYDAYIHLAGKVIHDKFDGKDDEYYQVNTRQTKLIYDQFLQDATATSFIFLSTIHVLTEKPGKIIYESFKPQPFTPYGKSKYEAENYIINNATNGKQYYVLRPSMIHGIGNKGNLNLLYEIIMRGFPYPFGSVNNQRSFVSVDNLSFIINELLLNKIESGLYHIADDEPTYTHDLIDLIAKITGKKVKTISVPVTLLRLIAKIGNVIPIPFNEHRFLKLTEDFIVSNGKIKKSHRKTIARQLKRWS